MSAITLALRHAAATEPLRQLLSFHHMKKAAMLAFAAMALKGAAPRHMPGWPPCFCIMVAAAMRRRLFASFTAYATLRYSSVTTAVILRRFSPAAIVIYCHTG
jgi:hypothetical protein